MAGSGPEGLDGQPHVGQQLGDEAPLLLDEGAQQMGLLDLLVAVLHGQGLGGLNGLQGLLGKLVHVHMDLPS